MKSCTKHFKLNRVELCSTIGDHDPDRFHLLELPLQCANGMALTIVLKVYPFPSICCHIPDERSLLVHLEVKNSGEQFDNGCYELKVAITPKDEQGSPLDPSVTLEEATKKTVISLTSDSDIEGTIIKGVVPHDTIIYNKCSIIRFFVKASLICIRTSKGMHVPVRYCVMFKC